MTRLLRSAAVAALALAATAAVASAAQAQSYNRLVVFGDSLSDNGNLYAATAGTNPPSPPYFQGRFSNGPVFTELLGFTLGRYTAGSPVTGSTDYAFGGARTDSTANPPGMRLQLQLYTGAGGRFGANDLVSVLGGANNIFQAFPGAAANPATAQSTMQAVVTSAAADVNFIVNSIASQGAGTVVVANLPRLGTTPQFAATGASGSALADYAGTTFNSALLAGLTTVAANQPNSNIIYLDIYRMSDTIVANPGLFGFTNVTQSCLNGATVCATPDTYLYWDGVHPTAAGHRLLAALANDYLYYGDRGAQTAVQGETAYRQREEMLDMASATLSGRGAWEPGTAMTFDALYDRTDTDARGVVGKSEAETWGGRVGLDYVSSPSLKFGVSGSFRNSEVDAGPLDFDLESYGFDAYAGWRSDAVFVNASAGGSIEQYSDITRVSALNPVVQSGKTDGGSLGAKVQGGLWFDMGGIAVSPRAAVSWVSTDVNDYSETGPAAPYQYADRTLSGTSGELALRAEGGQGDLSFYVEGGYRASISDDFDPVVTSIVGNTAKPLARSVDNPFGDSALASAGVDYQVGPGVLSLTYRGRFGDEGDSHMGMIGYKIAFQ